MDFSKLFLRDLIKQQTIEIKGAQYKKIENIQVILIAHPELYLRLLQNNIQLFRLDKI